MERESVLHDSRVLQFSEQLDKGLPQRRHNIGRVMLSQTSDQCNGSHAVLENLVVEGNEQ